MASSGRAEHSWSPNYGCHMDENHSNGVTKEDMTINLLQTQMELSLIREDFQDQLRELRQAANRHLDAMNLEGDDVRAGQMDISNMVDDLKNHVVSLQVSYVKMVFKNNKGKKLMPCVGIFDVVCAFVVTYLVFKWFNMLNSSIDITPSSRPLIPTIRSSSLGLSKASVASTITSSFPTPMATFTGSCVDS
ncbi:unnamed protein product [Lactuca saligna]|uniref:Uncharacterized protein n=1 Tax=Lactuca saligna TaxID=75948 RepID=A0AA36DWZ4_LACSI|nr:unnamed protein product [Lactuca saligna]